jgi:hypothetical protein
MEHLIKHYLYSSDELNRQEEFFPTSLIIFHHFEVLIHKIFPKFRVQSSTNRIYASVGFFLFSQDT